jgi:large subunit ribosomal protein L29
MELDKIRNLGTDELKHEEQQAAEQLFRLRFQMRLGQTEGVKKLRGLKKDVARIKTIGRERELGLNAASHKAAAVTPAGKSRAAKPAAAKKATATKTTKAATAAKTGKKEAR